MPLNMNTVGTGNGIGGNTTSDTVIGITSSKKVISNIYDQNVSSININPKNFKEYSTLGGLEANANNNKKMAFYNQSIYEIEQGTGSSDTPVFQKYEYKLVDGSHGISITAIPTTFTIGNSVSSPIIQLGDYLYIFYIPQYSSSYTKLEGYIYRFDGSTFTRITDNIMKYLFGLDPAYRNNYVVLNIYPINSDTEEGTMCLIHIYSYSSGSSYHANEFIGIFSVDNVGFHLIKKYPVNSNNDSNLATSGTYRRRSDKLFATYDVFNLYQYEYNDYSHNMYSVEYTFKINYNTVDDVDPSNPTYNISYTQTSLTNLKKWNSSDTTNSNLYRTPKFIRLSYPSYDTYIVAMLAGESAASDDDRDEHMLGEWYQLKYTSGCWKRSDIVASYNGSTAVDTRITAQGDELFEMFIDGNQIDPIIWMRRSSSPYSGSSTRGYIGVKGIDWSITYNSSKARYVHEEYLLSGDIIMCDDGIISVSSNGHTANVNKTTYTIPKNGKYTIITKMNDAYTYPSFVIIDKYGSFVYVLTQKTSDNTIDGYFIRGMKVNGNVVQSSTKHSYSSDDGRFKITLR